MDFEKYKNTVPYPHLPAKPFLARGASPGEIRAYADAIERWEKENKAFQIARDAYYTEEARLDNIFRADILEEEGLTDNPKADKVFAKAWAFGHHSGKREVANYVREFAELVK